jgi:ABC-type sugar transport system permease subunit
VVTDSAFKHWQPKYKRTAYTVQALGGMNFKMYRLLYSMFFGRNQFNAPFNDPSLFLRPFNLTSLFAIVTVMLPVIVSSIIGLIYVRWGYQLYITCIEMLVLEVALVVLQIIEYI